MHWMLDTSGYAGNMTIFLFMGGSFFSIFSRRFLGILKMEALMGIFLLHSLGVDKGVDASVWAICIYGGGRLFSDILGTFFFFEE